MPTINNFYWENWITHNRVHIPTGNIIPNIIPIPFTHLLPHPYIRVTDFHEIGTDPYPGERKTLIVSFTDGNELHFHEAIAPHRSIHINIP